MAAMTDYAENKIIDWLMRGQALSPPSTWYVGLLLALASDSAPGTEISSITSPSYARISIAPNLASWAGTQGAGTTTLSSGTGGITSNNAAVNFATPLEDWAAAPDVVLGLGLYDALTDGHLWFQCALAGAKSIYTNDIVLIPAGLLALQIDN